MTDQHPPAGVIASQFLVWTNSESQRDNFRVVSHQHQFFAGAISVLSSIFGNNSFPFENLLAEDFVSLDDCVAKELGFKKYTITNTSGLSQIDALGTIGKKFSQKLWTVSSYPNGRGRKIRLYRCKEGTKLAEVVKKNESTETGDFIEKVFTKVCGRASSNPPTLLIDSKAERNLAEVFIGSKLVHKNIIKPRFCFFQRADENRWNIRVLSPFQGVGDFHLFMTGNVWRLYDKYPLHREAILANIIKGVIEGLEHMHENDYVHGDLKMENIIICKDPDSSVGYFGKLIDFDNSCRKGTQGPSLGTWAHCAPECCRRRPRDIHEDLWALGSTLFSLFTGEYFRDFDTFEQYKNCLLKSQFEWTNDDKLKMKNLSSELQEILIWLLSVDPNKRPTCKDIVNSEWMKECERFVNISNLKEEFIKNVSKPSRPVSSKRSRSRSSSSTEMNKRKFENKKCDI